MGGQQVSFLLHSLASLMASCSGTRRVSLRSILLKVSTQGIKFRIISSSFFSQSNFIRQIMVFYLRSILVNLVFYVCLSIVSLRFTIRLRCKRGREYWINPFLKGIIDVIVKLISLYPKTLLEH